MAISGLMLLSSPARAQAETTATDRLASLLQESLASYDTIRDYQAAFFKQEKDGDILGPKEEIFLKFEKPFKIYMGWMNTHKKGLQVLYERGKHDGKLAIHKPGLLLGLAPVIFLDQNSPWVREGSESYDIEDAGIGSFLIDFADMCAMGASEKKLSVTIDSSSGSDAFDVSFPGTTKEDKGYFAYRVVVRFDATSKLPVKMDLYDWDNKPTGLYAYDDLRLNVGSDDAAFKKTADRHLYKLYFPPKAEVSVKKSIARSNFSPK